MKNRKKFFLMVIFLIVFGSCEKDLYWHNNADELNVKIDNYRCYVEYYYGYRFYEDYVTKNKYGICYSKETKTPTIDSDKTKLLRFYEPYYYPSHYYYYDSFGFDLNLETNATYYWRVFIESENRTKYSDVQSFTTPSFTTPENVIINGVCWATRNVAYPGTFALTSQSSGMFYQWNRKVGWNSTNPMINSDGGTTWDWDGYTSSDTSWKKVNDPSPTGYRVPTIEEIQSLLDETKVSSEWTTQNGVQGEKFTDKVNGNSIFLPAVSSLSSDGHYGSYNNHGSYWSSSTNDDSTPHPYVLYFNDYHCGWGYNYYGACSVRPVAE